MTVISAAATLAAAGCAIPGRLPAHGVLVALATVAAAPIVTCCAAMSARRGGRLPQTLLITATATDPSGGGVVILSWLAYWPTVAVVLGGVPVLLITRAGANAGLVAGLDGTRHRGSRLPQRPRPRGGVNAPSAYADRQCGRLVTLR